VRACYSVGLWIEKEGDLVSALIPVQGPSDDCARMVIPDVAGFVEAMLLVIAVVAAVMGILALIDAYGLWIGAGWTLVDNHTFGSRYNSWNCIPARGYYHYLHRRSDNLLFHEVIRQGVLWNLGCTPPILFFSHAYQLVRYLVTHILGISAAKIRIAKVNA
jgi:hypothetical protein